MEVSFLNHISTKNFLGREVALYVKDRYVEELKKLPSFKNKDYQLALKESFIKINRKLGGQHVQAAITYLDQGDLNGAGAIALRYYDKSYPLANAKCDFSRSFLFTPDLVAGYKEIARSLIKFSDGNEL